MSWCWWPVLLDIIWLSISIPSHPFTSIHIPHHPTRTRIATRLFVAGKCTCQTGLSSTTTGTAKLASNREESPGDLPWRGQSWNMLATKNTTCCTYCVQISVIDRKVTKNQECTTHYYQNLLLSIAVTKNQRYYYLLLSTTVHLSKYWNSFTLSTTSELHDIALNSIRALHYKQYVHATIRQRSTLNESHYDHYIIERCQHLLVTYTHKVQHTSQ